ncbi:hypothetical protein JOH50_004868 [Rhizobium leguminosarum]|uniref:hypothetical protein n=1 Tax=Rhizobium leguminosarum TaxID=384 RepID=UPI001AE9CADC|nr:hypothetical protein [Rhizobium leguminosarum]MBP2489141.1 hypothetical protein [Rhizobium leguminosarum]
MQHRFTRDKAALRRLLANLERLDAGNVSVPDLMAEPVLNDWIHGVRIVSCLEGAIEGDPAHKDGQEIRTGQLFAFFEEDGENFGLTLDGWYRLGSARKGTER